jgi:hypothetical protein
MRNDRSQLVTQSHRPVSSSGRGGVITGRVSIGDIPAGDADRGQDGHVGCLAPDMAMQDGSGVRR